MDSRKLLPGYKNDGANIKFMWLEMIFIGALISYVFWEQFAWQWLYSFVIILIVFAIISFTPLYIVFQFIFSIIWGWLGGALLGDFGKVFTNTNFIITILMIIGFLACAFISYILRISGDRYRIE